MNMNRGKTGLDPHLLHCVAWRGVRPLHRVLMFRNDSAVTIMPGYPYRNIQVITRLYKSPAEVLMGFDLDACTGASPPPDHSAH